MNCTVFQCTHTQYVDVQINMQINILVCFFLFISNIFPSDNVMKHTHYGQTNRYKSIICIYSIYTMHSYISTYINLSRVYDLFVLNMNVHMQWEWCHRMYMCVSTCAWMLHWLINAFNSINIPSNVPHFQYTFYPSLTSDL